MADIGCELIKGFYFLDAGWADFWLRLNNPAYYQIRGTYVKLNQISGT